MTTAMSKERQIEIEAQVRDHHTLVTPEMALELIAALRATEVIITNLTAEVGRLKGERDHRVRAERVKGTSIEEWRKNLSREQYALGDTVLAWVNEGDLCLAEALTPSTEPENGSAEG